MDIGKKIDTIRNQQNITRRRLCFECRMPLTDYYLKIKNPDNFKIGELKKISKVLNVSLSDILFQDMF